MRLGLGVWHAVCFASQRPSACSCANQAASRFAAAASSLAFDPSSGSILTADNNTQQAATAGGLAFDPSSGNILASSSNSEQDAALATSSSANQNNEELLQSGLGPSTSAAAAEFTPRSEHTRFIGKMLRSDLAAEVQQALLTSLLKFPSLFPFA